MKSMILWGVLTFITPSLFAKEYKLVTGNDYAPLTDERLPGRGLFTELVEMVFKDLGEKISIEFVPWQRGYDKALNGMYIGTFPYIDSPERREHFYFSVPFYTTKVFVYLRTDSPAKNLKDLKGQRICRPLGYAVAKGIDQKIKPLNVVDVQTNSEEQCFELILKKRADFIVINEFAWHIIAKSQLPIKAFRTLDEIVEKTENYVLFSKKAEGSKALVEPFNRAFLKLKRKGLVDKVIAKHLNTLN